MTPGTTQRDTQHDIDVSRVASGVTITAAAQRLGVSVRTVQRRLDSGVLRSIERDGRRLVLLDSGTAQGDTKRDTVTRHATENDATRDTAQDDMTTRYVAQIEAENRFLRLQVEEGNRNAAELRAALRKALDNAPKMITMGAAESAPERPKAPSNGAGEQTHVVVGNGAQNAPESSDVVDFDEIEAMIYRAFK